MKTIYLDNGATTVVDPEVVKVMEKYHSNRYGNASSIHHKGQEAKEALEGARHVIAESIGAEDDEIIFTSGGTESNNLVLKGLVFANKDKGHIITSKIEHDCVLNSAKWLEERGFEVTYLDVDNEGFVDLEQLKESITDKTLLVSIIHGNNETGVLQDLGEIYRICRDNNVYFHTDACQSYTKVDLSVKDADFITLNAHKIHGPKGVGVLYMRKGVRIVPLAHGGGHERNLRSGTENIPGVVGFAGAVKAGMDKRYIKDMTELRDYFIRELLKIPDTKLNGPKERRLCNNVNVSFRYVEGESLILLLDSKGVCASTGSACSSHSLDPSHVIMALDNDPERAHGSIRFTISRFTTKQEVDFAIQETKKAVEKLRSMSPLGG